MLLWPATTCALEHTARAKSGSLDDATKVPNKLAAHPLLLRKRAAVV